jgi:hypothetical protein
MGLPLASSPKTSLLFPCVTHVKAKVYFLSINQNISTPAPPQSHLSIRVRLSQRELKFGWSAFAGSHRKKAKPEASPACVELSSLAAFTSWAHQGGIHGLASVPTAGLIEGQTLFSSPGHHFGVPSQVFGSTQRLDTVDPAAVGVRDIERARHGVHGQVVFVCWVVALGGEAEREMKKGCAAARGPEMADILARFYLPYSLHFSELERTDRELAVLT